MRSIHICLVTVINLIFLPVHAEEQRNRQHVPEVVHALSDDSQAEAMAIFTDNPTDEILNSNNPQQLVQYIQSLKAQLAERDSNLEKEMQANEKLRLTIKQLRHIALHGEKSDRLPVIEPKHNKAMQEATSGLMEILSDE